MKYIVVVDEYDNEQGMVFSEIIDHSKAAGNLKVISAGKCDVGWDHEKDRPIFSCWGESVTLDLKSRPEDTKIVTKSLNFRI